MDVGRVLGAAWLLGFAAKLISQVLRNVTI